MYIYFILQLHTIYTFDLSYPHMYFINGPLFENVNKPVCSALYYISYKGRVKS